MNSTTTTQPAPISTKVIWTGRIMSALPILLLLFSASMKFLKPPPVVQGFAHLGIPDTLVLPLAIVELACAIVYVIPRTTVLGSILLTGFLGGAILAHLRVGEPVVMHVILGVLVWGGVFLRDRRIRALIPLRQA